MPQHEIGKLRADRFPVDHIVVDTETSRMARSDGYGYRHRFRLGCATYIHLANGELSRRDTLDFTQPRQFWGWVRSHARPKRLLWIWAHNMAFDSTILGFWKLCEAGKINIRFMVHDSPPTIVRATAWGKSIQLVDSLNFWPTSLAVIGEKLGLQKLPMPRFEADDAEWFRYCRNDTDILEKFVTYLVQFSRKEGLGTLKPTAAGSAWAAYRKRFMPAQICPTANDVVRQAEQASYYGGKVDCRFIGNCFTVQNYYSPTLSFDSDLPNHRLNSPIYAMDVNSLYPSVMKDNLFPTRYIDYVERPSIADAKRIVKEYASMAYVLLKTNKPYYPIRENNIVIYPVGYFSAHLAGPELIQALEQDHIHRIIRLYRYTQAEIFTEFVDFFYALKSNPQSSKESHAFSHMAKLYLNSLYGKFAQRIHKWHQSDKIAPMPWGEWEEPEPETGQMKRYRSLAWYVEEQRGVEWWKNAFPLISAYVTSYGRVKMNKAKEIVSDAHWLYSDTDSLHVDKYGRDRMEAAGLVQAKDLGRFRISDETEAVIYYGQKDYEWGGEAVFAGRPARIVRVGDGKLIMSKFDRLPSIFARMGSPDIDETVSEFTPNHRYPYGMVGDNGWVRPFVKDEPLPF